MAVRGMMGNTDIDHSSAEGGHLRASWAFLSIRGIFKTILTNGLFWMILLALRLADRLQVPLVSVFYIQFCTIGGILILYTVTFSKNNEGTPDYLRNQSFPKSVSSSDMQCSREEDVACGRDFIKRTSKGGLAASSIPGVAHGSDVDEEKFRRKIKYHLLEMDSLLDDLLSSTQDNTTAPDAAAKQEGCRDVLPVVLELRKESEDDHHSCDDATHDRDSLTADAATLDTTSTSSQHGMLELDASVDELCHASNEEESMSLSDSIHAVSVESDSCESQSRTLPQPTNPSSYGTFGSLQTEGFHESKRLWSMVLVEVLWSAKVRGEAARHRHHREMLEKEFIQRNKDLEHKMTVQEAEMAKEWQEKLHAVEQKYQDQVKVLKTQHENELNAQQDRLADHVDTLQSQLKAKLDALRTQHESEKTEWMASSKEQEADKDPFAIVRPLFVQFLLLSPDQVLERNHALGALMDLLQLDASDVQLIEKKNRAQQSAAAIDSMFGGLFG